MRLTFAVTLAATLIAPSLALSAEQEAEPSSGVTFDAQIGDLQLLGTGLRTKTFLKVKVYAIGLYVDPKPLVEHRDKPDSPELYKALVSSPQWPKMLFILTFDEHGGTYDHEPPPKAVPPDSHVGKTGFKFDRLGVRVPMILREGLLPQPEVDRLEERAQPLEGSALPEQFLLTVEEAP